MSDTLEYDLTGNYGLKKPWLDADDDIWGQHLNENMDLIDNLLVTRGFDASKYLPLTGGTITGDLTVDGQLSTGGDAFVGGTLWADDAVNVTGVLTADGVLNVNGALNAYGTLTVHDAMTVSDTLDVEGVANFDNAVNLANPPVAPGQAANKGYVDGTVSAAVGAYLPLEGGNVSGLLRITANNPSAAPTPWLNTFLHVVGADNTAVRQSFDGFGSNGAIGFRRAQGTQAAPSAVVINSLLGTVAATGYGATGWSANARADLLFFTAENWTDAAQGTYMALRVTRAGTTGIAEVMRLQASGNLSIGTIADAGFRLDVAGGSTRLAAATPVIIEQGAGGAIPGTVVAGTALAVLSADAGGASRVNIYGFGANAVFAAGRASGTRAAPSAVGINAQLASFGGFGYGATDWGVSRAAVNVNSDQAWTDTAQGARLSFYTTLNGGVVLAEVARFTNAGNLLIGNTVDAGNRLDVTGKSRFLTDGGTTSWVTITANSAPPAPPAATYLNICGADAGNPRLLIDSASTFGGQISFRSNGGTTAAPAPVAANQNMGVINYQGHDGAAYSGSAAAMMVVADALWSATSHPTRIAWLTTPAGSTTAAPERMRITSAGNLLIGGVTDAGFKLDVTGSARFSSIYTTALLTNAANDAAAATAGVALNQFYRNGSIVMQRVA